MQKLLKIALVIMLLITVVLVGSAAAMSGDQTTLETMIGLNIMWGYFLTAFAVASALFCAVFGMVNAPAGIKMTLLSVALVVIVVAISYAYASSHEILISNIGDGGFFDAGETVITECSVLVTYIAVAGAILVSLVSEVVGLVEANIKSKNVVAEEEL